jgi:hypothetical protein
MTVTAFSQTQDVVHMKGEIETLVVQLRLPPTGKFVIWGKVMLFGDARGGVCSAVLTTLDGATRLDFCESFFAGMTCLSLQSTLDVSQPNANQVVDLRCELPSGVAGEPFAGSAQFASLIAISVDALSGPVAPPS